MAANEKYLKLCLLGASFSTDNMGVGALAAGVIKCVKHCFPKADIFLLDYGKTEATYNFRVSDRDILVELLNLRFSKKLYLRNNVAVLILIALFIRLIPSRRLRGRLTGKSHYLSKIADAEITASIAGGDSFSDIYGMERFLYVALPQILVILCDKELVLLPQTIGPFRGRISRALAAFIMRRAQVVYSRDYTGLKEAEGLIGPDGKNKLRFSHDVGFVVDARKPEAPDLCGFEERDLKKCAVGLNVSGLLFMGGYTGDNMFGLKTDYKGLIYGLIAFLINEKDSVVILIPHVFGAQEHGESDSMASDEIYNELKPAYGDRLFMARGRFDQNEIKYVIGLCDFFIGSRMHACIAALSQCVPSVAIAYSMKFQGVMDSINLQGIVADPRTMSKKEIFDVIEDNLARKDEIRAALSLTMPGVRDSVLNLFKGLAL